MDWVQGYDPLGAAWLSTLMAAAPIFVLLDCMCRRVRETAQSCCRLRVMVLSSKNAPKATNAGSTARSSPQFRVRSNGSDGPMKLMVSNAAV